MKPILVKLALITVVLGVLGLIVWGTWAGTHMMRHRIASFYYLRAYGKQKAGEHDGAIADYDQAIKIDPKFASAYNDRGLSKKSKGDLEGAFADFDTALKIDPKDFNAYCNRGRIKAARHDTEGAISDFNRSLELNPKLAVAYRSRGREKQAKGDLDGALADVNRAVELDPRDFWAYCERSFIKGRKGDLEGALTDGKRAVEINPQRSEAFGVQGMAKEASGDLNGAVADFRYALKLNPKIPPTYWHLANVEYRNRDWADALKDFRRFCEMSEHNQDYVQLYIWLLQSRLYDRENANKELAAYLAERRPAQSGDWPQKVGDFLLGHLPEGDLFAAAKSPGVKEQSDHLFEAWFFAGMKKLLDGDNAAAASDFKKCLATEMKGYVEYDFAQAELKALEP